MEDEDFELRLLHYQRGYPRALLLLSAYSVSVLTHAIYSGPAAYLPLTTSDMSFLEVGIVIGVLPVVIMISQVFRLQPLRGYPRAGVVVGGILAATATASFGFVSDTAFPLGHYTVIVAIGLRILQGMGASICLTAVAEALSVFLPADLRSAVPIMGGCAALGLLLGPVCSGYLYHDDIGAWAACGVLGGLFFLPATTVGCVLPSEKCGFTAVLQTFGRICCLGCSCIGRCRRACVRAWGYEYDREDSGRGTRGRKAAARVADGSVNRGRGRGAGRVYRRLMVSQDEAAAGARRGASRKATERAIETPARAPAPTERAQGPAPSTRRNVGQEEGPAGAISAPTTGGGPSRRESLESVASISSDLFLFDRGGEGEGQGGGGGVSAGSASLQVDESRLPVSVAAPGSQVTERGRMESEFDRSGAYSGGEENQEVDSGDVGGEDSGEEQDDGMRGWGRAVVGAGTWAHGVEGSAAPRGTTRRGKGRGALMGAAVGRPNYGLISPTGGSSGEGGAFSSATESDGGQGSGYTGGPGGQTLGAAGYQQGYYGPGGTNASEGGFAEQPSLTLPEELQGTVATASLAFVPTSGSGASRTFVSVFAVVRQPVAGAFLASLVAAFSSIGFLLPSFGYHLETYGIDTPQAAGLCIGLTTVIFAFVALLAAAYFVRPSLALPATACGLAVLAAGLVLLGPALTAIRIDLGSQLSALLCLGTGAALAAVPAAPAMLESAALRRLGAGRSEAVATLCSLGALLGEAAGPMAAGVLTQAFNFQFACLCAAIVVLCLLAVLLIAAAAACDAKSTGEGGPVGDSMVGAAGGSGHVGSGAVAAIREQGDFDRKGPGGPFCQGRGGDGQASYSDGRHFVDGTAAVPGVSSRVGGDLGDEDQLGVPGRQSGFERGPLVKSAGGLGRLRSADVATGGDVAVL